MVAKQEAPPFGIAGRNGVDDLAMLGKGRLHAVAHPEPEPATGTQAAVEGDALLLQKATAAGNGDPSVEGLALIVVAVPDAVSRTAAVAGAAG